MRKGYRREAGSEGSAEQMCELIAHSTDAEHPFHGIVSSHSTAS